MAFASGCILILALWYMLRGAAIQLNPVTFVSLVFTVVVGAASLVLAIVALNFGRISERVMTERADKSIDIQMDLFQKSLGLQTQLFDKTMSTLESIGRSTGVTEQRLSDIHSLIQNPGFLKQVAGRAAEQVTSELSTTGKVNERPPESDPHLAEKLTKSIVEELSARLESLTRTPQFNLAQSPTTPTQRPNRPHSEPSPEHEPDIDDLLMRYKREKELNTAKKEFEGFIEEAIHSIPEAKIQRNKGELARFWEYTATYKGKSICIDIRIITSMLKSGMTTYDQSIIKLTENHTVDCLLFLFPNEPDEQIARYIDQKNKAAGGRIRFAVAADKHQLQNDLLAIFESVAAELPSAADIHNKRGPERNT